MSKAKTNRQVFVKDPLLISIPNDGVADVSQQVEDTLRFELQTFVCQGEYAAGLERILYSYVSNFARSDQPAVWVSGFYGSGKSHLVKVLSYLWTDYRFSDGVSARGLTHLTPEIKDLLKELNTLGKQVGGLHAAAGKLSHGSPSLHLALLAIIFRSAGLPDEYPQARFVLWLKNNQIFEQVKERVENAGRNFNREMRDMYASPVLAKALLEAMPDLAKNQVELRSLLKTQFPVVSSITETQMCDAIQDVLEVNGSFPCTLVVLDELQQYIGDDGARAYNVQMVTEQCCKHFQGRLLFVGTGQFALTGTANLQKLQDRYTVPIQLSDSEVETVTRQVVLGKKPEHKIDLENILQTVSGEIDRHLRGTRIEPRPEDSSVLAADYPILPTRQRFWEKVLRAVDRAGTAGQLRTQLKIVFEANRAVADKPLGTVVAADFIYQQLSAELLQTGVLSREVDELIRSQIDGTAEGLLRARSCALIFLIGQLPREQGADSGIRATPDTLADLLVEELPVGSSEIRKVIPQLLANLADQGHLMPVDSEYRIQTLEGAAWEAEYQKHYAKISNDPSLLPMERNQIITDKCTAIIKEIRLTQGSSKEERKLQLYFGSEQPATNNNIPIWIRDGWNEKDSTVLADAQQQGTASPIINVFIPRRSHEEIRAALAGAKAAEVTLQKRGEPNTDPGREAKRAIQTRQEDRTSALNALLDELFGEAQVYQGGGARVEGSSLREMINNAAQVSRDRLYSQFSLSDDKRWETVLKRARGGATNALEAIDYKGEADKHPVCQKILTYVNQARKGSDIRKHFADPPFGWLKDAIDGALVVLCRSEHLSAAQNGMPVKPADLDQSKIGVTTFKPITVVVGAAQRLQVRGLFALAGIPYKNGEEGDALPVLLQKLQDLAKIAGGEAPRPVWPDFGYLDELQRLSGNELIVASCEQAARIENDWKNWSRYAMAIQQRIGNWHELQELSIFATGLPIKATVDTPAQAIYDNRDLLAEPDPVPVLLEQLTEALRQALQNTRQVYVDIYEREMKALEESDAWQGLSTEQKQALADGAQVRKAPILTVADRAEVLASLRQTDLNKWKDWTDALPQRFGELRLAVARLLEPKTVEFAWPSRRLNSEAELDTYLNEVREAIMKHICQGQPVLVQK